MELCCPPVSLDCTDAFPAPGAVKAGRKRLPPDNAMSNRTNLTQDHVLLALLDLLLTISKEEQKQGCIMASAASPTEASIFLWKN